MLEGGGNPYYVTYTASVPSSDISIYEGRRLSLFDSTPSPTHDNNSFHNTATPTV